jgi:predicted dinucleotide-binding enzyme
MNIGILGSGVVGQALAGALIKQGHYVQMGSRTSKNEKTVAWAKEAGEYASAGSFNEAALFGDLIIICLNGEYTLEAVRSIDAENVRNKIVIDLTNPLDFSSGMPPSILEGLGNTTSLGEQVQEALPGAFVVKTLNTINYKLMIDARLVNNGDHNLFLCGNYPDSKNKVMHFLVDNFHWKASSLIDLGGMEAARAVEAIVPFWVLVYRKLDTPMFNFKIVQ